MSEYNSKIYLEDLDALRFSIERKDFESANAFSNRIMSNAYLFNEKTFGLTGFIFKELAREGTIQNQLKTKDKEVLEDTKQKIISLIDLIKKDPNKISLDIVWGQYQEVTNKARIVKLNEDEKKAYSKSTTFSEQLTNKIYKILLENRKLLLDPYNNILTGSISEIIRVIDVYSATRPTMYFVSLLIMLIRVLEYIKSTSDEITYPKKINEEFLPLLNTISQKIPSFDSNTKQQNVNDCLWDLICIWRFYFVKYHELQQNAQRKRSSSIKQETKSKIADALSHSLEKEIGGEK